MLDGTLIFFSSSTYLSVTPAVGTFTGGAATAIVKAQQPPGTAGIGGQSVSGALENATRRRRHHDHGLLATAPAAPAGTPGADHS